MQENIKDIYLFLDKDKHGDKYNKYISIYILFELHTKNILISLILILNFILLI